MIDRNRRLLPGFVDITSAAVLSALATNCTAGEAATAAFLAGVQPLLVRIMEWLTDGRNRQSLNHELDREFFENVQAHLDALCKLINETRRDVQRAEAKAVSIEEAIVLIEQYREHAHRSAQAERRDMMAAAAAASFRPDYDIEMKSRTERALSCLEPSDIAALRAYLRHKDVADGYWRSMRAFFSDLPMSNQQALLQSGCIFISQSLQSQDGGYGNESSQRQRFVRNPQITPLGNAVLQILATYKPDEADSMPIDKDTDFPSNEIDS